MVPPVISGGEPILCCVSVSPDFWQAAAKRVTERLISAAARIEREWVCSGRAAEPVIGWAPTKGGAT
jgi:hypothetical protein